MVPGSRKLVHFYERPDIPMLFDLSKHMGEVQNTATIQPEQHKRLFHDMMSYFETVGARIPKVNPDYDADAYGRAKEYNTRMSWGPFQGRRPFDDDEK